MNMAIVAANVRHTVIAQTHSLPAQPTIRPDQGE